VRVGFFLGDMTSVPYSCFVVAILIKNHENLVMSYQKYCQLSVKSEVLWCAELEEALSQHPCF